MNIDIVNVLWLQIGISKCTLHNELSTNPATRQNL